MESEKMTISQDELNKMMKDLKILETYRTNTSKATMKYYLKSKELILI